MVMASSGEQGGTPRKRDCGAKLDHARKRGAADSQRGHQYILIGFPRLFRPFLSDNLLIQQWLEHKQLCKSAATKSLRVRHFVRG